MAHLRLNTWSIVGKAGWLMPRLVVKHFRPLCVVRCYLIRYGVDDFVDLIRVR